MKIFAIRDDCDLQNKDLAYLLYYEAEKRFYIELLKNVDEWEAPIGFSSFIKKGETTINSYWSRIWVEQRIVPHNRQNIGQILKDNHLGCYDEYKLLMLSNGRCAQDDYYLYPMDKNNLPKDVISRFDKKIEDVIPLNNNEIIVFFGNGVIRKCDLKEYFNNHKKFSVLLNNKEYFLHMKIQTGGYGVEWDENLSIPDFELYKTGEVIPLKMEDFILFAKERIINTNEVCKILDCSRQYVNELVKKDKLHPIKTSDKNTLFLKSEVLKRKWL